MIACSRIRADRTLWSPSVRGWQVTGELKLSSMAGVSAGGQVAGCLEDWGWARAQSAGRAGVVLLLMDEEWVALSV